MQDWSEVRISGHWDMQDHFRIAFDDSLSLDFRSRDIGTCRIGQFEMLGHFDDSLALDFRSRDIGTCRIGQFEMLGHFYDSLCFRFSISGHWDMQDWSVRNARSF
jgi:hypothetical protein